MTNTSFEAILHQYNNDLPKVMTNYFAKAIMAQRDKKYDDLTDILTDLGTSVQQRTGIQMSYHVNRDIDFVSKTLNPYTVSVATPVTPSINLLNPKATKALAEGKKLPESLTEYVNGYIDFKQVKVSGIYSYFIFRTELSEPILDGVLDPEEVAAIMLHELGHAWDSLVMLGQGLVSGALAAGIHDFFDRHDASERRLEFSKRVSKQLGKEVATDNESELTMLILSEQHEILQQTTGMKFRAIETSEFLADAFAAKFHMGVSLAKALKKLRYHNSFPKRVGLPEEMTGLVNALLVVTSYPVKDILWPQVHAPYMTISKALLMSAKGMVVGTFTVMLFTILGNLLVEVYQPHGSHPNIKARLRNIRRTYVNALRQRPTEYERKRILEDMDAIDAIYDQLDNDPLKLFEWLNDLGNRITGVSVRRDAKEGVASRSDNVLYELKARLEAKK